jgi:hypothetical protein
MWQENTAFLAMAKPLINNEKNPKALVLSRGNNQEYIWRKIERGTHPNIQLLNYGQKPPAVVNTMAATNCCTRMI